MDQILKHKIGQMIIAGFPSPYVDAQAKRLVEDFEVGNFVQWYSRMVMLL